MLGLRILGNAARAANVTRFGALHVLPHLHPPISGAPELFPFRQAFTDDGSATGSSDMTVDGSVTEVQFSISASPTREVWIKYISVRLGDTGAVNLSKFAAEDALANGVEWCFTSNEQIGTVVLHDGIKTNLEFCRMGPPQGIGDGTSAFQADVSGAGETTYLPQIDMNIQNGMQYGTRLRKGSRDSMSWVIRDDLTPIVSFDIFATGSQL